MAAEKGYPFSLFALYKGEQITKYKTLEDSSLRTADMLLRGKFLAVAICAVGDKKKITAIVPIAKTKDFRL